MRPCFPRRGSREYGPASPGGGAENTALLPPEGEPRIRPCFPLRGKSPVRTLGNRGNFNPSRSDTTISSFISSASYSYPIRAAISSWAACSAASSRGGSSARPYFRSRAVSRILSQSSGFFGSRGPWL